MYDLPNDAERTEKLHLGVLDNKICDAVCICLNIAELTNVTLDVLRSAMILAEWVVMGARGGASLC